MYVLRYRLRLKMFRQRSDWIYKTSKSENTTDLTEAADISQINPNDVFLKVLNSPDRLTE